MARTFDELKAYKMTPEERAALSRLEAKAGPREKRKVEPPAEQIEIPRTAYKPVGKSPKVRGVDHHHL